MATTVRGLGNGNNTEPVHASFLRVNIRRPTICWASTLAHRAVRREVTLARQWPRTDHAIPSAPNTPRPARPIFAATAQKTERSSARPPCCERRLADISWQETFDNRVCVVQLVASFEHGGMRDHDMYYGADHLHDYPRRFPRTQQLGGSP